MADKKTKTKAVAKKASRAKTPSRRVAKAKRKHKKPSSLLKLTQETIDGLAEIVGRGNFRYVARGKMGVCEGTFNSWLSRGRRDLLENDHGDEMSLEAKLVMALDKAENEVHATIIHNVMSLDPASPAAVKLQLEYLYRRHGKLYSKNPNAHDDDTGETFKVSDPLEELAEKLAPYIEN